MGPNDLIEQQLMLQQMLESQRQMDRQWEIQRQNRALRRPYWTEDEMRRIRRRRR